MSSAMAASIELTASQVICDEALPDLVPPGTRVYLPDIGSEDWSQTIAAARRLTDLHLRPVPHVAARRCPSVAALDRRLGALVHEAGVNDTLLIGGDAARPSGPFASTLDLLETGVVDRFGIREVGIAGHPEGSPVAGASVLDDAMTRKAMLLARTGAKLRIVTQFGFDADGFAAWADRTSATYPDIPIHMGIAGPARITTLLRYAAACGVGNSLSFLRKRAGSVTRLARGFDPDEIAIALERHAAARPVPSIEQLHVFAFGGLERTAHWLAQRGSWNASGVADTRRRQRVD